jgi:hypothetical protein
MSWSALRYGSDCLTKNARFSAVFEASLVSKCSEGLQLLYEETLFTVLSGRLSMTGRGDRGEGLGQSGGGGQNRGGSTDRFG